MFYRVMKLPAIVAALALGAVSHGAEPGKSEATAPTTGSGAAGASALGLERGTAGLRIGPASAAAALPKPGPARLPAAAPADDHPRYGFARSGALAPEEVRYGLAPARPSPLKLSAGQPATKTGWQWSGRVGPLRWMSPLDGEGESKLRFGGRLPGQPRMPGMGHFNVGIHYHFE